MFCAEQRIVDALPGNLGLNSQLLFTQLRELRLSFQKLSSEIISEMFCGLKNQ